MNNQARQWPFQMTAGLSPAQLVYNYQLRQLFLLFSIKKDLYEWVIEPLMSQTVWKNGMGNIKQVAYDKHVWPISGLAGVAVKYDKEQKEIHVVVAFHEDTEQTDETNRILADIFGEVIPIPYPQLKYTFSGNEAESESLGENIKEANNLIRLPLAGTPSSRK